MNPLFRPQVLAKVTDPDQLDQALRLVRPRHLLGFGIVTAVLLAGLVWSLIATAPILATGPGLLLFASGVSAVTARNAGHVEQILVQPGERVNADTPIAHIRNPERLDELSAAEAEYREAQDLYEYLLEEFNAQDRLQADLLLRMSTATTERILALETLTNSLAKLQAGESNLRKKGVISEGDFFETETKLAETANDLAMARSRITELTLDKEQQSAQRQQRLAEQRIRAQNLARRVENLRLAYERDRVILANSPGTLAEIVIDVDDPVIPGQIIARLTLDQGADRGLIVIAYLPAAEGKKVKPGMIARVAPSTVKFEFDGYALGRVTRVANLPASREALLRRLRNTVLVEDILKVGTPFEIEVRLQTDPATFSGYAWTSGDGPDILLEPGTLARTQVVVDRIHLISLLFPAMDYVYGWVKEGLVNLR